MTHQINSNISKGLCLMYFGTALLFLCQEIFKMHPVFDYFGLLRLFTLIVLYIYSSQKRNPVFLSMLFFVLVSNFLFFKKNDTYLMYGMIAYLMNRLFTVILVFRILPNKKALPIIIASIPFLFFYLYMIFLAEKLFSLGFLSLLMNSLLMSFLGGLALSTYYLDNESKNKYALLLVSILLFVMQNLIFLLQKYYGMAGLFEPISIVLNTASLFIFYKFIILCETSTAE